MTADRKPLWKVPGRLVNEIVVPLINDFTRSDEFAALTAIRQRSRNTIARHLERTSRRTLHLLNIPAASDVNRLLSQIANLEREVRRLRNELGAASLDPVD